VLAINWKTVSKDPDLKRISKGAEIEKVFAQLGLDSDTVTEFAVYGGPGAQASSGFIVKGSFDSNGIVSELTKRGWNEKDFEGKRNPE
jgi:hypothetical protein